MNHVLFGRHSWPFVLLGGLVAAACLVSTWYINRLQADLARAVRHDATRMEAADEFQVQLRRLRFHTVLYAADPAAARRSAVLTDTAEADAALDVIHRDLAPDIRICASIVALDGSTVCTDLLGDDLVSERGLSTQEDDHRGIGEVSCAMVEYADIIAITDEPSAAGTASAS